MALYGTRPCYTYILPNLKRLTAWWLKMLIHKIPWDQKLVDCSLGSLCEEFFFFIFFFWTSELHISQAFREYQACLIPTLYESVANFCWKWVSSSFFFHFLRSSYMLPYGWKCPRAEGHGAKKEVSLPIKSWFFTFFHIFFLLMVLHDVTFNVTITI